MSNPEFKKTILIGLGGAGQQILLNVKRLLMDTYGIMPPSVKLLSFDTDTVQPAMQSALSNRMYGFSEEEFLHLSIPDPKTFIEGSESVQDWYVLPMPVGAITTGAGAVRQNGRLALFYHMAEVLRRIDQIITSLDDMRLPQWMATAAKERGATTDFSLSPKPTEIFICGSLAGGTGSGTFLDIGIMFRNRIPNALINGYFLLHWPFRDKAFAHRIRGNVYAALSELDNVQSIMYGKKDTKEFSPYKVEYAGHTITVDKSPFSLCHLIDGRNERGESINDNNQLCETVGNALFLGMSSMIYGVNSVTDNLLAHINVAPPRHWGGRYARYSSIGVGSIYYPARELHRLISAECAVELCREALAETLEDPGRQQLIEQDITRFVEGLSLKRDLALSRICQPPLVAFEVERGEMSDTDSLQTRLDGEEQNLETQLKGVFESQGKPFLENVLLALRSNISNIEQNPKMDSFYLDSWLRFLRGYLDGLRSQAIIDYNNSDQQVISMKEGAREHLEIAAKARYIPLLGGPRKTKVEEWQDISLRLLNSVAARTRFGFERDFYSTLIDELVLHLPADLPTQGDYKEAMDKVIKHLLEQQLRAKGYLDRLRQKAAQILVGEGRVVVTPDGLLPSDTMKLDYAQFKNENNIATAEDYLRLYKKDQASLVALFTEYAEKRWETIKDKDQADVQKVLEIIGYENGIAEIKKRKKSGLVINEDERKRILEEEKEKYISQQFENIFRVSSALWSYNRGMVNEVRGLLYDRIINIGVPEQASGAAAYEKLVQGMRQKFGYRADHAFSGTGDYNRIWLLNYAAALPVYFLSDLQDIKKTYEEEIIPTYHIDQFLEMNVPDLFPVSDFSNIALRILSMSIVKGIDVIEDIYRPEGKRGHKFICRDKAVMKLLDIDEPKDWDLFRDMYSDVEENNNLRAVLEKCLRARVKSISADQVRTAIKAHIAMLEKKLNARDFSRLVSARLTYREIRYLEAYLAPEQKNGLGGNIDAYIAGK